MGLNLLHNHYLGGAAAGAPEGARAPVTVQAGLEAQITVEVLVSWAQPTRVTADGLGMDTHVSASQTPDSSPHPLAACGRW